MAEVRLTPGMSVKKATGLFKKKVENEGIMKDYDRHTEYKKPSIVKKEKCHLAQRRRLKEQRRKENEGSNTK